MLYRKEEKTKLSFVTRNPMKCLAAASVPTRGKPERNTTSCQPAVGTVHTVGLIQEYRQIQAGVSARGTSQVHKEKEQSLKMTAKNGSLPAEKATNKADANGASLSRITSRHHRVRDLAAIAISEANVLAPFVNLENCLERVRAHRSLQVADFCRGCHTTSASCLQRVSHSATERSPRHHKWLALGTRIETLFSTPVC